ncbi:MAG: polysaccharide pyruvyl transferase family protein [Clostridiales bacterium]|nr:polysaccharide pyruvyl transferase family protein [Clostridiales bacterium]
MKNVGLCIVYKNCNYGSILQSYATLLKLQSLGCDYEIIRYTPTKNMKFYLKAIPRLLNRDMIYGKARALKRKIGKKIHREFASNDRIREKKFHEFVEDNFEHFSRVIHEYSELQEYAYTFSDVLVGSDQLWLPSGLATNFYNLRFVPDGVNKIAYSASFGVSKIPSYQRSRTKEYLSRINHLSVREQAGARIIKDLTGRDAQVILDPTMIIERETWDNYIPDKEIVIGDYIFCYFLGNNPSQRDEVRKLAAEKNLKIVVLRHLDEYISRDENFGDIAPYDIGPAEFVNLVRHAKYVCTDSFHGSVFSIIYHKQFISFSRYAEGTNSRNSRLDTLFNNIGISRRYKSNLSEDIDELINWDYVEEKLQLLRKSSSDYIENAIGTSSNK